jgi:tripartite-type tricarboxylate transporter receptor subunit TctC
MKSNGVHRRSFLGAAAGLAVAAPQLSFAQAYPNRTVRVIVPFAAGGPSDIIARIVADALQPRLGQSVVVDNRAGGGANIGIGQAARAEPDGYTLLITTSAFVINPSLYKKIPFDPIKDFAPICDLAVSPQMLSVLPGTAKTLGEFIAKAKAAKGKLNYSSPGLGTQAQLTVELLKLRAGIDMTHIPFTGGPPAVQALLSKSVDLVTNAVPTSEKLVHAGTINALAVSGKDRWFSLPQVPTLVEAGFPGFITDTFVGLFAPIATPKDVVARLAAEAQTALKNPAVIKRAQGAGFQVIGGGPEVLAARVVREVALNREIIKKAGIAPR